MRGVSSYDPAIMYHDSGYDDLFAWQEKKHDRISEGMFSIFELFNINKCLRLFSADYQQDFAVSRI